MALDMIDECALPAFRDRYLCPAAIYAKIPSDDAVLLVAAPPGVGKTMAAHGLVPYALARDHNLVIYVAPTRALIGELMTSPAMAGLEDRTVVLRPRPRARCGDFDAPWQVLESSGCAALGKETCCAGCPQNTGQNPCFWPDQMDRIGPDTQLVVLTEAYLGIDPGILRRIIARAKSAHPLILLDEGTLLTTDLTRHIELEDLRRFHEVLLRARCELGAEGHRLTSWIDGIDLLFDSREDPSQWPGFDRYDLLGCALAIQSIGQRLYGPSFRYLGPKLSLLNRGYYHQGRFSFVPVIGTSGADVVVFSPYLPPDVIEERLGRQVVTALPPARFRHSETRFANISDAVGTLRSMKAPEHLRRVVGFFVALLVCDQLLGRRSVVVCKKALIQPVARKIVEISSALRRPIHPVILSNQEDLGPAQVVMLNYGIVGVNSLSGFDALYCIGGFYVREDHVAAVYQQLLPPNHRHDLRVRTSSRRRTVRSSDGRYFSRAHARRAQSTLKMLERRVVLQAVGRVRPFTTPADVILFQMDDVSEDLGDIETHATLAEARTAWNVPVLAEMARAALGDRMRAGRETGLSYRALAENHGCSVSTAHKAVACPSLDALLMGIRR